MSAKTVAAVVALFALCTSANGAHAQSRPPTAAEIKLLQDCAAAHREDDEGELKCAFKLVADPCIKSEGGSNLGTADCYRIEAEAWDRLLNDNYREVLGQLDDKEQKDKAREMQRAWIASRDASCGFFRHKIRGSMAVPLGAACYLRETARRALFLAFLTGV